MKATERDATAAFLGHRSQGAVYDLKKPKCYQ